MLAGGARRVTDARFLAAARTLAAGVDEADLAHGSIYPPLRRIREISLSIATAVAELAYETGLSGEPRPADIRSFIASQT